MVVVWRRLSAQDSPVAFFINDNDLFMVENDDDGWLSLANQTSLVNTLP